MAKYIYTARNFDGRTKGGEMEAQDEKWLAQQLRAEGFLLTSVKEKQEKKIVIEVKFFNRFKSVPLKEKMMFARNLSVMISSGLTISRAIDNLTRQTKNKNFQKILKEIGDDLQGGKTLSEGLAKYPGVFSDLFVNMVRVGEVGGNLEEVMEIIANQLEKDHELISKVKGAMTYPAVIIAAMIGIGILMLTYILPKITGVFTDMKVALPKSTLFVIAVSDFLRNHHWLVLLFFIFIFFFFRFFLQTQTGKKIMSFAVIHVPIVKNIIIKVNCARFSRIYSSLLRSGVSVIDALKIVGNTLTNFYYKKAIAQSIEQVQKGVNLSKILGEHPSIFPVLVPQMMEVGEETGKTEEVLAKLAEFYEAEVEQITKNLSSVIEPVLMILIGGAVGFFAVSMLQPMYSLMENIK